MVMLGEALVIALLILICLIVDGVMLIVIKILPRYKPTDVKMARWEAGNVPMPDQKYVLPMQYFGFMFLFMAVEPVAVLYLLFTACEMLDFVIFLLLSLAIVLPAVFVGYKLAVEIAEAERVRVRERVRGVRKG